MEKINLVAKWEITPWVAGTFEPFMVEARDQGQALSKARRITKSRDIWARQRGASYQKD